MSVRIMDIAGAENTPIDFSRIINFAPLVQVGARQGVSEMDARRWSAAIGATARSNPAGSGTNRSAATAATACADRDLGQERRQRLLVSILSGIISGAIAAQ